MAVSISQLNAVDVLQGGDQLPVSSLSNGDTRRASLTALLAFVQANLQIGEVKQTQYATPTASGFSVQISGTGVSKWLILTPLAAYAAGSLVLPLLSSVVDGQEVLTNTTQTVTALTVNGNGAGVVGAPTTLAAGGFFRLRFDAVLGVWYRVG